MQEFDKLNRLTRRRTKLLLFFGVPVAAVLGMLFCLYHLPIATYFRGEEFEPINLLAWLATTLVAVIAFLELKARRNQGIEKIVPAVCCTLVALHFLVLMYAATSRSNDFRMYLESARSSVKYHNAFANTHLHPVYPPFPVHALANVYRAVDAGATLAHQHMTPDVKWGIVFYFYQYVHIMLFILMYYLCYRFAVLVGLRRTYSAILATLLVMFNAPLFDVFQANQLSIYPAVAVLLAMVMLYRRPWISGLATAVGVHIKVYPILLLLPWVVMRKYRLVLWTIAFIIAIGVADVAITGDTGAYRIYFGYMGKLNSFGDRYADNSVHSVIYETVRLIMGGPHSAPHGRGSVVDIACKVLTVPFVLWLLWRMWLRERSYKWALKSADSEAQVQWAERFRHYGHISDSVVLMLCVSPMVWTHHYVLAVPVVLWAILAAGKKRPWLVMAGSMLTLCVPKINVYLFGFHNIAGLLMLAFALEPRILPREETIVDLPLPFQAESPA